MGGEIDPIGLAEARSALAWWLDAGVDIAVQEQARNWLKPAASTPLKAESKDPQPALEPSPEPLPDTLVEFRCPACRCRWRGLAPVACLRMARNSRR